jgi:hypothetical protein
VQEIFFCSFFVSLLGSKGMLSQDEQQSDESQTEKEV